ncbi:MAG TPA: hypothetical protein VN894_05450 [Polyangiaceae bacterium]|nr:hypothetical protein [Polyangiaceae bacterium]
MAAAALSSDFTWANGRSAEARARAGKDEGFTRLLMPWGALV